MADFRSRNDDPGGTCSVQTADEVVAIGILAGIWFTQASCLGMINFVLVRLRVVTCHFVNPQGFLGCSDQGTVAQ